MKRALQESAISIVGIFAIVVLILNPRAFGPAPTKDLWFDVFRPAMKGNTP